MQNVDPDSYWFVARNGSHSGPFTRAELALLIQRDTTGGDALVWKPGWSDWQSQSGHFATRPTIEAATTASSGGPRRTLPSGGLALALWVISVASYALLVSRLIDFGDFGNFAGIAYASVWISASLIAVVGAVIAWKRANELAADASAPRGGGLKAGAICMSVIVVAAGLFFGRLTSDVARVAAARGAFQNYTLAYDPTTRTATLTGAIGPGFKKKVGELFALHSSVKTLKLASPGGLLEEAIGAAKILEQHPDVEIEVDSECNSACIVLFMAGKSRVAEYQARFGFHAASAIIDSALVQQGARVEGKGADRFLIDHGVPPAFIDKANALGPNKLNSISAIEMSEAGLTALLIDGEAASNTAAKWRWIALQMETSPTSGKELAEIARALSESSNAIDAQSADALFTALRAEDQAAIKTEMSRLIKGLVPRILESADPVEAINYMTASNGSLNYLAQMQQWPSCGGVARGSGLAKLSDVPETTTNAEFLALASAIRSANRAGWPSRPLPTWAESVARNTIDQAVHDLEVQNIPTTGIEKNDRALCLFTVSLLKRTAQLDPVRATASFRWISTQAS